MYVGVCVLFMCVYASVGIFAVCVVRVLCLCVNICVCTCTAHTCDVGGPLLSPVLRGETAAGACILLINAMHWGGGGGGRAACKGRYAHAFN